MEPATDRELQALSQRRRGVEARLQQPARVILPAAPGWENSDNDVKVASDKREVRLWRQRFLRRGFDALRRDAPRFGRTPTITAEVKSQILRATLHAKRAATTHHWSMRTLAEHRE